MYCLNCGNSLANDAVFCTNCGTRQNQPIQNVNPSNTQQEQQSFNYQQSEQYVLQPQPTNPYGYQTTPYMGGTMPPKNNTAKIILISLAGLCVVLAVVLLIVLKPFGGNDGGSTSLQTPPNNNASSYSGAGDTNNAFADQNDPVVSYTSPDAGQSDATDSAIGELENNGQSSGGSMISFDTPAWSKEPIYTVLTNGVWTSVGLATNPNQQYGEDGVFYISDFEGCVYYVEFYNDLTCNIKYIEDTSGVETYDYEIMDIEYCDTYSDGDGLGYRFYYGNDGRLYMCAYEYMEDGTYPDITDFLVFEFTGDYVDWSANE